MLHELGYMQTGPGTGAIQAGLVTRCVPEVSSKGQRTEDSTSGPCSCMLAIPVYQTRLYNRVRF